MKCGGFVVGLTGPTGCGKTSTSLFLKSRGFEIIDADEVVAALYLNCENLISKVDCGFDGVVRNGCVDRKKLSEIVFKSRKELLRLEKIVWPFVVEAMDRMVQQRASCKVVVDAPTLFESGAHKLCNFSIAILSSRKIRLKRIIKRDSLTKKMAMNRIKSQQPDYFYINKADGLVFNDGLQEKLFHRIYFLIDRLKIDRLKNQNF